MSGAAVPCVVLRAAQRAAVPWKNGGGLTREVAAHPAGSGFGTFDWRISIAEVAAPGPFSLFPGIERRMALLAGRLALRIEGRAPVTLTPESPAIAFSGDVPAFGEPQDGPVTDLNLMTRRARCVAELSRHELRSPVALTGTAGATLLLVALCEQSVVCQDTVHELARLDAVLLPPGSPALTVAARGPASFHLADIRPCAAAGAGG